MTRLVCDANVALKWFHSDGEPQVQEARALAVAAGDGVLELSVLDLTYFEVGNALASKLRWAASRIAALLSQLPAITGEPLRLSLGEMFVTADLAVSHGLSFYDASYWAAARSVEADLATLDSALLAVGAGETPARLCERLGLATG
ncbi:MAG TPA: type II toxin-antitoxin system VapC family toxin [Solirubrobacterales bacterium]|nr:type II toxin-antitoxin system VapC family toxin [Solirubrobacterales bacterium]